MHVYALKAAYPTLAGEVAGHSPADQLPIENTLEGPVRCLSDSIGLSSGVQLICDAEKMTAVTSYTFLKSR